MTASSSTSSQSWYRFGTHIQGPSSSTQSGYAGTRLPQVRLLALLGVCKRPWSPRGRGEMAMADGRSLVCLPSCIWQVVSSASSLSVVSLVPASTGRRSKAPSQDHKVGNFLTIVPQGWEIERDKPTRMGDPRDQPTRMGERGSQRDPVAFSGTPATGVRPVHAARKAGTPPARRRVLSCFSSRVGYSRWSSTLRPLLLPRGP